MIEETNHQITYIASSPHTFDEVQDVSPIKADNLTSVPEPKTIPSPKKSSVNSSTIRGKK